MAEQETGLAGPHLVRYGIAADQKYLIASLLGTYDQLVVNARMVAHMATSLALFISQRAKNKPYLIDPETHAFQHSIEYLQSNSEKSKGEIKRSIRKLVEAYGEPLQGLVQKRRPILPEHLTREDQQRREFCERVIKFQLDAITDQVKEIDNAEYYEFLKYKGAIETDSFRPRLVIAPYFCMDGNTFEEWLPVNISCAKDSIAIAQKLAIPLAIQIVISQSLLFDETQMERLVDAYKNLGRRILLVWVDSFNEHEVSPSLLKAFVRMIKKLKEACGPIVNLYGSYFSIMLLHHGILDGVTHSLEYGEERPLVPVGGGIPTAKFYLPALHMRLRREDALRAVRSLGGFKDVTGFLQNVCDCDRCKGVIVENPRKDFADYLRTKRVNTRNIPYPQTKDNSVTHYMLCKEREFKKPGDTREIVQQLNDASHNLREAVGVESTHHCRKWAEMVSGLAE